MDIFDVLNLIGGLALFLFGMQLMGDSLEKRAGGSLKRILEKLTSNRFTGFLLGLGVTCIIQSSSATTVMVVGFVNSGIMKLGQAINIIMGANIGTTITSWILSLTGIEGSNLFIQLCKPTSFTPILAVIGIILIMAKKNTKTADTGMILLGFAVLMFGMDTMSGAVAGLKEVPEFTQILTMFSNPILGVLAGAVLTGIIQSSSASVGILQALSSTGAVTFGSAIPIIMGQNIGTCVTAMLSSVGANKNARRTAVVHLSFNVIGTVVLLVIFTIVKSVVDIPFINGSIDEVGIAIVHTAFNILATAMLFPFAKQLEKLACFVIKDATEEEENQLLDTRLMTTPAIAIDRSKKVVLEMFDKTVQGVLNACSLFQGFDKKTYENVIKLEDEVDKYEDKLGTYLVKVSWQNLSEQDSRVVSELLHIIGDIERISDHSVSIAKSAEEFKEKDMKFSESATKEMSVIMEAVTEILRQSVIAFNDDDMEAAMKVEVLEGVVDELQHQIKAHHISRLRNGKCTIEQGFVMTDIVTCLERIADHCSNVAGCVQEIAHDSLGIHAYEKNLRKSPGSEYYKLLEENLKKYNIN